MPSTSTANPLVSMLIPAHNAASTLLAAVHSCLNQSYDNIEVLVNLNNCSDNSDEILKKINNPKLKIIYSTQQGIAHARNALVQAALGKYLAWLDADDIAIFDRIALQVQAMEQQPDCDVLGTACSLRNGKVKKVIWPAKNEYLMAWLPFKNPFVQSSLLIRATANPTYNAAMDYVEDYDWLCKAVNSKSINKINMLPQVLCSYFMPLENKPAQYNQAKKLEEIAHKQYALLGIPWTSEMQQFYNFTRGLDYTPKLVLQAFSWLLSSQLTKLHKAVIFYFVLVFAKKHKQGIGLILEHLYLLPLSLKLRPKYY